MGIFLIPLTWNKLAKTFQIWGADIFELSISSILCNMYLILYCLFSFYYNFYIWSLSWFFYFLLRHLRITLGHFLRLISYITNLSLGNNHPFLFNTSTEILNFKINIFAVLLICLRCHFKAMLEYLYFHLFLFFCLSSACSAFFQSSLRCAVFLFTRS